MDITTKLLLKKYNPTSPLLVEAPVVKSLRQLTVVMSSAFFPEVLIEKCCHDYNLANRADMSNSFILLADVEGIPAGSWVSKNKETT